MHSEGRGTTTLTHRADEGDPHASGGNLAVGVQAKLLFDCRGGAASVSGEGAEAPVGPGGEATWVEATVIPDTTTWVHP